MVRESAIAGLIFLLAACADSQPPGLHDVLSDLIGKPAADAVRVLVAANSIHPEKSGTEYTWTAKTPASTPQGSRSHRNAAGAEVAAAIKSNPNAVTPQKPCTIVMETDVMERIKTFRLTGDSGHCEYFERMVGK